jgi:hypothetical protein
MKKILIPLYIAAALVIFTILVWYISVPTSLIKDKLIETISASAGPNIHTEITGLSKGLFFNLHFESLDIYDGDKHAIRITGLSLQMSPAYLYKRNLAVTISGKLGSGDIHGDLHLPDGGTINADNVGLDSIPYMKSLGIRGTGSLSAEAILKKNSLEGKFRIEGLHLEESPFSMIPLINSFNEAQGIATM